MIDSFSQLNDAARAPFPDAELLLVCRIGVRQLEAWGDTVLKPMWHRDGEPAFDIMQAFAAYVGGRYLHEGSTQDRATGVVEFLARIKAESLEHEFRNGRTFPCTNRMLRDAGEPTIPAGGLFVPAPRNSMGRRLDTHSLWVEFLNKCAGRGRRVLA